MEDKGMEHGFNLSIFRFYGYERDSNKGFTKKVIFLLFLSLWLVWVWFTVDSYFHTKSLNLLSFLSFKRLLVALFSLLVYLSLNNTPPKENKKTIN